MKPVLEHLPKEYGESFIVKNFDYKDYPIPWHYHPELEIVLVTEGTGKRFIGDHICDFEPGNLTLIGSNVPHAYRNDESYNEKESKLRAKSILIHFTEETFGRDFLSLPEATAINNLLKTSKLGVDITGDTFKVVSEKLQKIIHLKGLKRWLCLMEIIIILAESKDLKPITNGVITRFNEKENKRLRKVFEWIIDNFDKEITLSQAAEIAQMNENSFSRFFSRRTRKRFSDFVREMRLQKASKLLIENKDISITQICYECGYNNLSNFNRQFLNYYQMSPVKYRKSFLSL